MKLSDATPYDIFSATIDGEFSAAQIEQAAKELGIDEREVLGPRGHRIVTYLMEKNGE